LQHGTNLLASIFVYAVTAFFNQAFGEEKVMDCKALGAAVAEHWISRTSLPLLSPNLSMDQAVCIRDVFLAQIQPLMGRPLGYKAAVITPPAQRDLGLKEPLGGIYLAAMFRPADGATIPVTYGARPIVEAKLLAIVKDEAINDAQTVEEVARSIAFLLPSIELGDSLVHVDQKITAPILIVYNVGARAVLTGTPIPFDGTEAATEKLKRMTVTTLNVGSNTMVDQQSADVIMGNPMNAVLWIVRNQRARGVRLVTGDRLGLGAMSRIRPTPGLHIATIWEGFTPEPATVEAVFR
jgi:2-keto-4-pentenoate hydratase